MDESRIARLMSEVKGGALRYTQCNPRTAYGSRQVLILDTVGILASVYGLRHMSYIGGGFGVGIHNTLEAATFGLPVAFGPNYRKFKEARDLVTLGAARLGRRLRATAGVVRPLRDNEEFLPENQPYRQGLHHAPSGCDGHHRQDDLPLNRQSPIKNVQPRLRLHVSFPSDPGGSFVKRLAVLFQLRPRVVGTAGNRQPGVAFAEQHPHPHIVRRRVAEEDELDVGGHRRDFLDAPRRSDVVDRLHTAEAPSMPSRATRGMT